MYTIYDLASYYCYHHQMTYKKLQNVLYYTYAWSMVLSDDQKPLFDANFTASTHGPRDLRLIALNKKYGYNYIEVDRDPLVPFNGDDQNLIDQITTVYIEPYSGIKLDRLVKQEIPWKNGRTNSAQLIDAADMIEYYNQFADAE